MKNKWGWDNALDVWGVQGIDGVLGIILLGVIAVEAMGDQAGLIGGDTTFFLKEVIAVVNGATYAFIFTYIMLALINLVIWVKVTEEEEEFGLKLSLHGEKAYDEGAL